MRIVLSTGERILYEYFYSWGGRKTFPWVDFHKPLALQREMLRGEILAVLAEGPNEEGFRRLAEQLLSLAA